MLNNELGKQIRQISLWVLIICDALSMTILWFRGQMVWFTFLSAVTTLVIGYEIWGVLYSKEKTTISNMWKRWAKAEPFWAYTALLLMISAFVALGVHLAFF